MNIVMLLKPKSEVAYIREESTLRQALEKMKAHGYSALPVLDQAGRYKGTVSEGDFLWEILDKNGTTIREGEKYTVSSILHVVQDTAQPEQPSAGTSFADVAASAYYADPVAWAVGEGITNGTSATTFSPDQTCTRAQIITFLWRAAGSPEPQKLDAFSDVNAAMYYAKAAAWAAENGMADGSTFSPNAPCTREMAVEFMWKHAGSPDAAAASFADISSAAVDWAVENGVTNGTSATTFSPDKTCTRAQIVTFLYRAFAE